VRKTKLLGFPKIKEVFLKEIKILESLLCHWCSSKLYTDSSSLIIRKFLQLNSWTYVIQVLRFLFV